MISRSSSFRRSRHTESGLPINSNRSGRLAAATDLGHRQGGIKSEPRKLGAKPEALMLPVNDGVPKITKLLLKVNIERSLGPVNVVMSAEKTVGDLIKAATEIYVKEKRRPLLAESDPESFQLHYSQFCLESLSPEEKLVNLGSRNFFMCSRPVNGCRETQSSGEAEMVSRIQFLLVRIIDFLL